MLGLFDMGKVANFMACFCNSIPFCLQVNKTHNSEEETPQVSFFTGGKKASQPDGSLCSSTSTSSTSESSTSGTEQKVKCNRIYSNSLV